MHTILAVEDDPNLLELLSIHLPDINCQLDPATDGEVGFEMAQTNKYDLIILDVMLPSLNGMDLCKKLRAAGLKTPIVMLTAKSEEIDRILGLEIGADDYVTKPFSIRELLARIKAQLRRVQFNQNTDEVESRSMIRRDDMTIDMEKRKVLIDGNRIDLSRKEFDLLALLAARPGVSYDRNRLLNLVWGHDFEGFEHTVNSHINRLRAKIEKDMSNPRYILTTWGIGYRFNEDL